MVHENKRKSKTVRNAASASHRHAAFRQNIPYGGTNIECFPEFGGSLVPNVSKKGTIWNSESSPMGTTLFIDRFTKRKIEKAATARSCGSRLHHRSMDAETYCTIDSNGIPRPLHACWSMETIAQRFRVELPETGEASSTKERESHCRMEKEDMAPYKKKPKNLGPTLHFLTKVAFCSFRLFAKRGLRWGKHQFFATATAMKKYRVLAALPFLPAASVLDCLSVSMPITSRGGKLLVSCDICCVICVNRLSLFGMVVRFIREQMLKPFWSGRNGFMYIDFLPMLRNLIRLNTSGLTASAIFPTALMKIRTVLAFMFVVPSIEFVIPNNYSSRVLNIRNCHGIGFNNVSIIS